MKKNNHYGLMVGSALCALMAPAMAQAADKPAGADGVTAVQEVVITAQRRAESVQNVPIAVTAFAGATVEAPGVSNIIGLNGLAPNVVLQSEGLVANVPMVAIRGMSSSDPDPNSDPKVSTIIDGVYVPFASATMLDLFDIERVEVLKGPQGVLFGKNNLAGTINVITSLPTAESGVEARATFGSNGLRQFRGKLNSGAFADGMLRAKLAVNLRDYDGYSTNVLTGHKLNTDMVQSARGAIDFRPTDSISSTLVIDWIKEKTDGPAPHVIDNGSAAYKLLPDVVKTDIRQSAVPFDPFANTTTYGGSWTTSANLAGGQLTAVLGYRHLKYLTRGDFDGLITPVPGLDVTRQFSGESKSAEVRYVSPTGQRLDYVVGVYAQTDDWNQTNTVLSSPTANSLSALAQSTHSYAAFALANFHATEALTLSVGGRYSKDEKNYQIDSRVFTNGVLVPTSSFKGSFKDDWGQFTPRVTAEYRFTPEAMAYANYSQGYKAGGYNSRGTVPENVGPYDPEKVDAYEVGAKTDLLDRSLRFNAALFYNKFHDLQSAVTRQGALRPENVTVNIAEAETYGLELEATYRPTRALTLAANFARLYAHYTSFCADTDGVFTNGAPEPRQCGAAVPVVLNGKPNGTYLVPVDSTYLDLANAPPYSASLSANYRFDVPVGVVELHGDARYTSRYNTWGRSNDPSFYRDDVVLLNASASLTGANDHWGLTVYGRNLTDRNVISGALQTGASPILQFYQPPREFGVEISTRF
jgi:iron complex outermembrane receptor protein